MAAAQYRGAGRKDADTRISFPLLKNDFVGQTTAFYIQAAGEPAQVTMMYKTNDGETYTDGPHELVADEMHIFNPAMAGVPRGCEPPSLQAACVGSAVATSSTGEIVGIYTEYPTTVDPATFVMATRGFTTGDTDTRVAVPVIKNQWVGRTTALTVQNAETDARVTVNVAFNGVSGTCADESYSGATISLEPGESTIYFPRLGNMGGLPTNCFGSALVTASGGEIVAVVNEAGAGKKTAYSAFDVSNATRQVALPLVKKLFVGRTTGVVIQNVGNSPTDVVVDLHVVNRVGGDSPGNVTSEPFTIPPGEAKSLWQVLGCFNHFPLPIICEELNGTVSNVMITSTTENIGAIAQESGVGIDVDVKNYEGFNISASDR